MKKGRAFSLLSGGLDSLLATRLIMEQGIEVVGLHFITPFFGYHRKGQEARYQERWRKLYGIEARIVDVSQEYFEVLRNPPHGYGKNFNPCIDCKVFLFSKARIMMEEEKADFLISGEVLGQRPMSQRRDTMRIVERDSGADGILLRPLCAQLLKPTRAETEGLVDRTKLLGITGRGRKPQMELAERMGIRHYPTPAGGCLLTDPEMAGRVRKFFTQSPEVSVDEILLLQVGRHFQLSEDQHLVVGRREEENNRLLELFREGDTLLRVHGIPGPLGLFRGRADEKGLEAAASIVARYSKAKDQEQVEVHYGKNEETMAGRFFVSPAKDDQISNLRY
jgi:tRNA U34 2-thiouridine synthase MnmA/TrmU